jgi:hypothetical protein
LPSTTSEEAARSIQARLAGSGCRTPSEFVERPLCELRARGAAAVAEKQAWLLARDSVAVKVWGHDADALFREPAVPRTGCG